MEWGAALAVELPEMAPAESYSRVEEQDERVFAAEHELMVCSTRYYESCLVSEMGRTK